MRLGVVPYLNSIPLIDGLSEEIFKAPPAKLAKSASADDLILAPIVQAFEEPGWFLVEGCGIGSWGPVETVKLFLKDSGPLLLDEESKTSAMLLKILLKYLWKKELRGTLLIGDKVWKQPSHLESIDLGEAWSSWTGKPFVWACWMTRSETTAREYKMRLVQQLRTNLTQLEKLAAEQPPHACPDLVRYWKCLRYEIGEEQKEAVALFQKYWVELNKKPMQKLEWV